MRKLILPFIILLSLSLISCSTGDDTQMYDVNVSITPSNAGTISPAADSSYEEGKKITLQAKPTTEYLFSEWSGDVANSDNSLTITVDQEYNITANFELKTYELAINTEGEGSVSEEVLEQKSKDYEHGTVVELTANPDDGYTFVEWQGDVTSTENPTQITVDDTKEVTAVFQKKSYELTVNTEGEGAVNEEIVQQKTKDYGHGTVVELTANPAKGWEFLEWTGATSGSENPIQITVDDPTEVTAVFERKSYDLSVNTKGEGEVVKDPDQQQYKYNNIVDLQANPAEGYKFVEWQGDFTGSENPAQITVDEAKEVTAVFEKESYTIETTIYGDGNIELSPLKSEYLFNEEVEISATASNGYEFIQWSGEITGNANPNTISVTNNLGIEAIFKTPKEALVYQQGGGVFINGRVYSASLQLHNNLLESVNLVRVTLKGNEDDILVENTDGTTIDSKSGISFNVDFGIEPTIEDFEKYTVEWEVEYKGETIIKVNTVGESERLKKKSKQNIPSINLKVN